MTLEEVIADALPGPEHIKRRMVSEGVHNDIAKAVRDFLLSDDVVEKAARRVFDTGFHPDDRGRLTDQKWAEWPHEQRRARNAARAALSSITGDE